MLDVVFKDQDVLLNSLKEMGYTPIVHKEAQSLEGYRGDKRSQKAHIILPRKQVGSSSNDVGFEKTKKGYKLHASQFDSAWRTGAKLKKLNLTYTENKIKKEVSRSSKFNILGRKVNKDGKIEIRLRIS